MGKEKHELTRQQGQTIIIIALMFLALVILVAIAIDGSTAYLHRRIAQNAADAAALAAAQELGHFLRGEDIKDEDVKDMLDEFARRNDVVRVEGFYLNPASIPLAEIGTIGASDPPTDAFGVWATAYITSPTFLGGIIGLDGLPLDAEAEVLFDQVCTAGSCLLPIAVYAGGFNPDPGAPFVDFGFEEGVCYNLWDGQGGGNFGWLNWSGQGEQYSCKMTAGVGDCSAQCIEFNMDPANCVHWDQDVLWVGDWVGGTPGVNNASGLHTWLDYYIDNKDEILAQLMLYDDIEAFGSGKATCGTGEWPDDAKGEFYHVAGFATFKITGYRLSKGRGSPVMRDDPDYPPPEDCIDFPSSDGLCCVEWLSCDDPNAPDDCGEWWCNSWGSCEFNTGNVNRITGVFQPWTEDAVQTCDAVGNVFAPRMTK
ncbi:MAG: pilus assembly protein TadG-related protein [Anaerolineae bacterium]|jgi:hypothetical protein